MFALLQTVCQEFWIASWDVTRHNTSYILYPVGKFPFGVYSGELLRHAHGDGQHQPIMGKFLLDLIKRPVAVLTGPVPLPPNGGGAHQPADPQCPPRNGQATEKAKARAAVEIIAEESQKAAATVVDDTQSRPDSQQPMDLDSATVGGAPPPVSSSPPFLQCKPDCGRNRLCTEK